MLVIALFTVVLLEIHPFQDGNGRLSRVLTTLLLQADYAYVPFSSLESIIDAEQLAKMPELSLNIIELARERGRDL